MFPSGGRMCVSLDLERLLTAGAEAKPDLKLSQLRIGHKERVLPFLTDACECLIHKTCGKLDLA